MEHRTRRSPRRLMTWLASACCLFTLLGVVVTAMAFSTPTMTQRKDIVMSLSERVKYAWTASLYPNRLYGKRSVASPGTVFTNITRALNMEFSYQVNVDGASEIRGTCALDLTIRAGDDWSKRVALVSPRLFTAKGHAATFWVPFTLNLPWLNELISEIEAETAFAASEYTLLVQPSLALTVGGETPPGESLQAPLTVLLVDGRSQLVMPAQSEFVNETSVPVMTTVPATLPVLGVPVRVMTLRVWSASVAGTAALFSVWLLLLARVEVRADAGRELRRLQRSNRRLFVQGVADLPAALPTVELADLEQVIKVAAETDKPVVHAADSDLHYVVDSGVVYWCGATAQRQRIAGLPFPTLVSRRQRRDSASGT